MNMFKRNYKLWLIILLIAIFLGTFLNHRARAPKKGYADFHCYYVTGQRILNHENIYVIRDTQTAEFRYTPIFAVLMAFFAFFNENNADSAWFIINFVLMITSMVFLNKLIIPEHLDSKTRFIIYALVILGILRLILHNLSTGQANIMMLSSMIIGLYLISKKRELLGGATFAFSIMIKYSPLIFIPYFLLRGKFKLVLAISLSIIIYFMLPSLVIGLKTNFLYIKNLGSFLTNSTILDNMTILNQKNQSLYSMVQRTFTHCRLYWHAPPMPLAFLNVKKLYVDLIFAISALILYALAMYIPPKTTRARNTYSSPNINYAQLLICVILFNMNAWMHNYILLSMSYFIIVYYLVRNQFRDKAVLILCSLSYILNLITIEAFIGKASEDQFLFYSPYTLSALIAFFALLKINVAGLFRKHS